jgi:hypothetical protein
MQERLMQLYHNTCELAFKDTLAAFGIIINSAGIVIGAEMFPLNTILTRLNLN